MFPDTHESVLKRLLLQDAMLNELVDKCEHDGVGGSLNGGGGTRGEGEEDPRGEEEEEDSSCHKIPHLFVLVCENLLKLHEAGAIRTVVAGTPLHFNRSRFHEIPRWEGTGFKSLFGKYRRGSSLGTGNTLVRAGDTSNARTIGLTSRTDARGFTPCPRHHKNGDHHDHQSNRCPLEKLEFHLF
jgi:hypothetical protein